MGASGGPKIVKDDLKVYLYAVDNTSYPGSGTTWKDLSGNGYDATLSAAGIGTVSSSLNTMAFKSGDADFAEVADLFPARFARDVRNVTKRQISQGGFAQKVDPAFPGALRPLGPLGSPRSGKS